MITLCTLMLVTLGATDAGGNAEVSSPFAEAQWLRSPVFEGRPVLDLLRRERSERPPADGPRNVHTLFRHEFELPEAPRRATLVFSADDYAKIYVNGEFVVQGPEPTYPFAHSWYGIDVTASLREGVNVVAAHVYYQGLVNRVWNSGANRAGFVALLQGETSAGTPFRVATDAGWRTMDLRAFSGDTIGYATQFLENIDLRMYPAGWRDAGYDDSSWRTPLTGFQDHEFRRATAPPLEVYRVDPVRTVDKGAGNYFYDFGTVMAGHTRVRIIGPLGHAIRVLHGEELAEPDRVRYRMRANCNYDESVVLSGSLDTIEFYDYRSFRYLEIENAPGEPEVWVDVRHHPWPGTAAFESSFPLLNDIWRICANGIRYGSQGGFLDCPSREKGQYLGDALIAAQSHLTLTADPSLTRKALLDFHDSQRICPGMMGVAPGSFLQEIAEYSLQYPLLMRAYHQATGDDAFVRSVGVPAFEGIFAWFQEFENEHGLLSGVTDKWVVVDWPANLRDGFDYEYASVRENAVLNAFYYASHRAVSELLEAVGLDGQAHREKAEKVGRAFIEAFLDPETGLFLDAPGSSHSSLHANALPLAFGMVPDENVPGIVGMIREKRLSCGVYIASFVIEACYVAGESDLGYDLITSTDKNSWHEMLRHGATTCMEVWSPDQKPNMSWLHPWSSSPVYLISRHVMGLQPGTPGWATIRFAPNMPEDLETARFTVPIPQGRVTVDYTRERGFTVTAPLGVQVINEAHEDVNVLIRNDLSHTGHPLDERQTDVLTELGWDARVGSDMGVWVSVGEQVFRVIKGGTVVWEGPCATSAKGVGQQTDSYQTPRGWHSVAQKVGDGAPLGQVFRGKGRTSEVWKPGDEVDEDLVLTRLLALAGEEPGLNKGGRVDSFARHIYIHGTNDEERIGVPSSHGCIRLRNADVVTVFDILPLGTPVIITEE